MPEHTGNGASLPNAPRSGNGKAALYARLARLKKGAFVASLVGFGALAGLAAEHQVGSTATGSPGAQPAPGPAATQQQAPDNGYFNQSGQDAQGGYGFGQSPAQQAPIAGSSAS